MKEEQNSGRMWLLTAVFFALFAGGVILTARAGRSAALRTEHSRPAEALPAGAVLVSESGKTFHRPGCRYIHGKVRSMPAPDAAAAGYSPCVRCLKEAVGR